MNKETFDNTCIGLASFTGQTLEYVCYFFLILLFSPLVVVILPLLIIYGAIKGKTK